MVVGNMEASLSEKLKSQISQLPLKKRIQYPKSYVVELYPESFGSMTEEALFERKEEIMVAKIKVLINNVEFNIQCHAVLGQFFDMTIRPVPSRKELRSSGFSVKKVEVNQELE